MSTRVVDQVDTWEEQSFSGGYRALHDLADREFSGVVRAGGAELYMTRGVPVGVRMGEIEDFESSGTAYEAPADALPLLAIMQERNDEVKAKYYTEKTSISKVDQTLSDGGFTGFVELSENVLSGDYYLVYQAGKSMSVGYVGEAGRLISGDEAFETADDEVGIYKVRPTEIEPIELPEPEEPPGEPEQTDGSAAAEPPAETEPADEPAAPETTEETPATGEPSDESPATGGQAAAGTEDAPPETPPSAENTDEGSTEEVSPERDGAVQDGAAEAEPTATEPTERDGSRSNAGASGTRARTETGSRNAARGQREEASRESRPQQGSRRPEADRTETSQRGSPRGGRAPSPSPGSERGSGSAAGSGDLETKAIPSLNPELTEIPDRTAGTGNAVAQPAPAPQERANPERGTDRAGAEERQATEAPPDPPREPRGEPAPQNAAETAETAQAGSSPAEPEPAVDTERIEELEAEVEERDEEIERLEEELESASAESEELEAEIETLREERDGLASEVERLEDQLRQLEEELGAAVDAEQRITAGEALGGTDIFVRYRSKGKPTLEKAHGSSTRKDEVNENLRLEKHTQFDAGNVAVGGQSYHEFLESTLEYQFVRWVVRELLFEIRETGHEKELGDLYDVLPQIDRAELAGVVDVVYTEDGQETQSQESFDVVLRNRMGHPLLVANLNDTREATTEGMMERLITSAERVGQSSDTFSGAFLVTESFFDPGALEVASDATQGGLLSRDKRKSFVNLSRKTGYHLCLVEARNENFHLAVPEL